MATNWFTGWGGSVFGKEAIRIWGGIRNRDPRKEVFVTARLVARDGSDDRLDPDADWFLPGRLVPWLTVGRNVVTGSRIENFHIVVSSGNGDAKEFGMVTRGGQWTRHPRKPDWVSNPELHALSAAHFAAVLRGDSLLLIIADWFADRGVDDMERVCRDLAAKGGA